MESQSSVYRSFQSDLNFDTSHICKCKFPQLQGQILQNESPILKVSEIRNQILKITAIHQTIHLDLDKLIDSASTKLNSTLNLKSIIQEIISKQSKKCRSILHKQAQQQIINGQLVYKQSQLLILKLKQNVTKKSEPVNQKGNSPQIDTTFSQQSFLQIQQSNQSNPFIQIYKSNIFHSQTILFQNQSFKVKSQRLDDGIRVSITNFDQKQRTISIDQTVPADKINIRWSEFGHGKFISNCKITMQEFQIPIPLPINYLFKKRFTQGFRNAKQNLNQKLKKVKRLIIKKIDNNAMKKLQNQPQLLCLNKQADTFQGIISLNSDSQMYLISIIPKYQHLQITIKTNAQSNYFKDIIQFMIFTFSG